MASKLNFRIRSVKCVDETGGSWQERFGNDEIYLGGSAVPSDGNTTMIPAFSVYPHFDDGDVKVFDPPRVMHTFNLSATPNQEYGMTMVLIEKDSGGMNGALQRISDEVRARVKERLQSQTSTLPIPTPNPALSVILATVGPIVVDWVKRKLLGAIDDDIFPPVFASERISSPNHTWSGSSISAQKTARVTDHGGIYEIVYDWQLV